MSDNASGTPDENRPESSGNPPPSDPTAQPPSDPYGPQGQPPSDPNGQPPSPPHGQPPSPSFGQPPSPYAPPGPSQPPADPPPGQDPWQGYVDPNQTPPPPPPPSYGVPGQQPPAYGTPPPGYGTPPPGYGTPPPGYGPPPYGNQGFGAPGYGPPPAYGLPSNYYAGPEDPLVSPDFAGWFRRSFTLLSAVWQPMTLVQLVWAVPLLAVGIVGAFITSDAAVITDPQDVSFDDFVAPLLVILPFTLAAVVLSMVGQLATLDILVQRATGRPISVTEAVKNGLRRFFPLLGWQIVAGLMILVGLLFCILPGIYFGLVCSILTPIILLERGQGVGRAFQLFHADFGAALGRIATIFGFYIAFAFVEGIFTTAIDPSGTAGTGIALFTAVLSTGFSVASGVVISPLVLTAYADMRARHEPFSTAYLVPQP
ncbi:hypothetical protein [Paractinoplanes lichenicola]|uniref:Glycerophosphoryl diester phosphodiesterase membrane domain-containing protein n=1 Tax=Paractinoplanes lichenicola TaxID=2802976 RepID=A0ABS1W206_9ACTN|nr:hypothetical protein [Actinoplanes lichenicola]MBL7260583.1 hypothetical protein [Actinoplanes lichenicola]